MKKLLTVILSVFIIFTSIPVAFAADSGFTYQDNGDGTCKITGIKNNLWKEPNIDIPSILETQNGPLTVTEIAAHAFKQKTALESITIPETVTSIGGYAFYYCSNLSSVAINIGVKTIGIHAFDNCKKLSGINVQNTEEIGDYAFYRCTALSDFTYGPSLKKIGKYAFRYCETLDLIRFKAPKDENASKENNLEEICDNAFEFCTGLTSLKIPDSLKSLGSYAFKGCSNLEAVDLGNGAYTIGACAFQDCPLITEFTIPDNIISIGTKAFTCYDLIERKYVNSAKIICSLNSTGIDYAIANGCPVYITDIEKEVTGFGDIDGSGAADTSDARTLLKMAAGIVPQNTNEDFLLIADLNRNEIIDTADANVVLKLAAKIA